MVLDTQPAGNVTIMPSSNNPEVTLTPSTLTFTSATWNAAQTVTVSAAEDSDAANDSASVTHRVSGADYVSVSADAVAVTVTDDDASTGQPAPPAPPTPPAPPAPPAPPTPPAPPANAAPAFGSASAARVVENGRAVLTVRALDPDAQDDVSYSLFGGADRSRFSIDAATGELSFAALPDYENPSDAGGDNEYVVTVRAASGAGERERSAEQTITVTVTNVEEVVLAPGTPVAEGGVYQQGRTIIAVSTTASAAASVTLPDTIVDVNGVELGRVTITIADAPSTPLPDRTAFGFDAATRVEIVVSPVPAGGVELCLPAPEALRAASGGQPLVVLHFTDGSWRVLPGARKGARVCASGVSAFSPFMAGYELPPNAAPVFGSASAVRVVENVRAVLTVRAADADAQDGAVRYSLSGGADRSRFSIDAAAGELSFAELPDYEYPSAAGGGNDYAVTVRAASGAGERERSAEQTLTVTVTDAEEVVLAPGTPVTEGGVYQQGQTTIAVSDTAAAAVSVTLPDALADADGAALRRVTVKIADAPSAPLPDRTGFGFDAATRVEIAVSPVPAGGVGLCLPVSAPLRAASGGQPLTVLHFTGGTWRALPGTDEGDRVCTSGVTAFAPFMAGFRVPALADPGGAVPAWLGRFGRTVTDQVLDAVAGRLSGPRSPGLEARFAGQALPSWSRESRETAAKEIASAEAREAAAALRRWTAGADGDNGRAGFGGAGAVHGALSGGESPARQSWSPAGRDFLTGTSFALTSEAADGGLLSFWGRGALTGFDGREGDLSLDGEAAAVLLGADRSWRRWTAGVALGRSLVEGGYRSPGETGEVDALLNGVYPYVGAALGERLSAWASAGYGAGELTLRPKGGGKVRTDLSLAMGAAGLRGEVLRPPETGGLSLAVKGDARFTRTSSDAAVGRLAAAEAEVWLVRAGVEGSRRFMLGDDGATITPSFEAGARFDGGDAETGYGADIGGGVALADPARGVTVELKARGLAAHEAKGFREWGASASMAWDPRPETERGLALSLRQSWGASSSGGMDALLSRGTLEGLAANGNAPAGRLEAELGYGAAMFGGGFTGTPNASFALTGSGREWRLGWRLTTALPGGPGLELRLEALRSEAAGAAPDHAIMLRGEIRF